MDKTLKLKKEKFQKALLRLNESIIEYQKDTKNYHMRDSVIKRFEFCFDLCWKTSKLFLYHQFGNQASSPKETFRFLRNNKIIDDKETELLMCMTNDRNTIVHEYEEKFSQVLAKEIVKTYYPLINKIFQCLKT